MTFYKTYIKRPFSLFLNTFKSKKLALILGIDIIFYIIFSIGFMVFASKAKKIMMSLQGLNLAAIQNLNNIDISGANQLLAQLQSFIFSMLSAVFLLTMFIMVILTIIKGYEWGKITKNKLKISDYVRLFILNIIWFIIWVVIFTIPFFFIGKQKYLTHFYYLIPPLLYFTLFLYLNFAETKKIGKSLLAPIKEGIIKLHKYISAIVIIVLFFEIPFMALKAISLQNKSLHLILFMIISLITLAVYKMYFYSISTQKEP